MDETRESQQSFFVSFAGLSMILLAMLIYLNSLTTPDSIKNREVAASVRLQFARVNQTSASPTGIGAVQGVLEGVEHGKFPFFLEGEKLVIKGMGEDLFVEDSPEIKASAVDFLARLSTTVDRSQTSVSALIRFECPAGTANDNNTEWKTALWRTMSLRRFFLDSGLGNVYVGCSCVPPDVGTVEGESDRVLFTIEEHPQERLA